MIYFFYISLGKVHYYLKWQGYSEDDNTWEPAENLQCQGLIDEYERKQRLKKSGQSTSKEGHDDDSQDGLDRNSDNESTDHSYSTAFRSKRKSARESDSDTDKNASSDDDLFSTKPKKPKDFGSAEFAERVNLQFVYFVGNL